MKKRFWNSLQKTAFLPMVVLCGTMTSVFVISGIGMKADVSSNQPNPPPIQNSAMPPMPSFGGGHSDQPTGTAPSMPPFMHGAPSSQTGQLTPEMQKKMMEEMQHRMTRENGSAMSQGPNGTMPRPSFGMPVPPMNSNGSMQGQHSEGQAPWMHGDSTSSSGQQGSSKPALPSRNGDGSEQTQHNEGNNDWMFHHQRPPSFMLPPNDAATGQQSTSGISTDQQSTSIPFIDQPSTDQSESDQQSQSSVFDSTTDQASSPDSSVSSVPPAGFEDIVITNSSTASNPFSDVSTSTKVGAAASDLFKLGIVGGFSDGTFRPDVVSNKAEMSKFLVLAKTGQVPDSSSGESSPFSDVAPNQWYTGFVNAAAANNIVRGNPNGTFGPEKAVNTAEFLAMVTRTFNLPTDGTSIYKDVPSDAWFAKYTTQGNTLLPDRGILLDPSAPITRAEAVVAIEAAMKMASMQQ